MATPRDSPEDTSALLIRARGGDPRAADVLLRRHMPALRRWASGRLPKFARGALDTDDLVQDTLVGALRNLQGFEHRGNGAFAAYLRQTILNRIQDEVRRACRHDRTPLSDSGVEPGPSPLEEAVGREVLARYETALSGLDGDDHALVVMRVEWECSYAEIAEALGRPSPDAARMAVARALVRLARGMGHEH